MYIFALMLNAGLYVLICAYYLNQRSASIFHPLTYYLFFHGLVYVIRPFFVEFQHLDLIYSVYKFRPDDSTKYATLFIANLALISFLFGVEFFAKKINLTSRSTMAAVKFSQLERSSLVLTIAIALPFIAWSFLEMISISTTFSDTGALFEMRRDTTTNITVYTDSVGYLVDANIMGSILACCFFWAFRFRLFASVPLLVFIALRAYMGQARWAILFTAASAVLLYCYQHRRRWPTPIHVLLGSGLLVVFWILGQARNYVQNLVSGSTQAELDNKRSFFDNMDFANLEFLQYQVAVVPEKTHSYGYFTDLLQIFTEPVPRILWPGKPIGVPIKMYNLFDFGNPIGMTFGLPGEGWQGFGYIGVVVYSLLIGLLMGWIYYKFCRARKTVFIVGAYAAFLPLMIELARDGVIISLLRFYLFSFVAVSVWYVITRISIENAASGLKSKILLRKRSPLLGATVLKRNSGHSNVNLS